MRNGREAEYSAPRVQLKSVKKNSMVRYMANGNAVIIFIILNVLKFNEWHPLDLFKSHFLYAAVSF